MAEAYQVNATEMMEMLRQQYDGYHFSSKMTDIFNPFSLLNAFKNQSMDSYWFRSGTPTYLIRLLRHTNENLNEFSRESTIVHSSSLTTKQMSRNPSP